MIWRMNFNPFKLTFWTLVTSYLLIVGMGHGAVPILIAECISFFSTYSWEQIFDFSDNTYNRTVTIFCTFWLIFQIALFIAYKKRLYIVSIVIVILMWLDLLYLSEPFTLMTAVPFVVISLILTVQSIYKMAGLGVKDK